MVEDVIFNASELTYKDGKLSRKNYQSTSDTMYQIASCSKFITSLVVAKLYELGKLDYDTDINKYLKKWKCPAKGITLRHLLTHTSGSTDGNGYLGMEPFVKYTQNLELNIKIISGESYSKPFNIVGEAGEEYVVVDGVHRLAKAAGFGGMPQKKMIKVYVFDLKLMRRFFLVKKGIGKNGWEKIDRLETHDICSLFFERLRAVAKNN